MNNLGMMKNGFLTIRGLEWLAQLIDGVKFRDGGEVRQRGTQGRQQMHFIHRAGVLLRTCALIGSLLLAGVFANPTPALAQVNLDSRVYNLCVRYDGTTLDSYKCTGGDNAENWTLLSTGATGRYALENAKTGVCLLSSGTTPYLGSCNTSSSNDWWTLSAIAGTNGNQDQLVNASGYCLSNDSLSGLSGGLSADVCNANYWTQQWKQVGSPETDRTGNTAHGPWIGHANFCTDHDDGTTCDSNGKWMISDSCEDANFAPVRGGQGCLYDSQLCAIGGSCLWRNGFTLESGTNTYMYSQVIDKINHRDAQLDSAYVSTYFVDTIVGSLGGNNDRYLNHPYIFEARIRLNGYQMATSPVAGHARITLGVLAVNYDNQKWLRIIGQSDKW